MEMKVDDLLQFCAYYTLAKTAVKLPHSSNPPQQIKVEPKTIRPKKVEVPSSKKVKKPKMEHVSTINKAKSTFSPIQKQ